MKSSKLIELLKEVDPSGETEVFIDNCDIYFLERKPAYWDGTPSVLIRDSGNTKSYNVVGLKHLEKGDKIEIRYMGVSDCIENDVGIPIDYSDMSPDRAARQMADDEILRQEMIELHKETDRELGEKC